MPWTQNDAERHTRKATTPALKELGRKSPMKAWNEPATRAELSEKRTLWSVDRHKQVSRMAENRSVKQRVARVAGDLPDSGIADSTADFFLNALRDTIESQ